MLRMYCLMFPHFGNFFDIFDTKLQQLSTGGIIEHYTNVYDESLNLKGFEHLQRTGPEVLTIENLEAGFVVWIVSISFAILIFMFEWICQLSDYLVFKWILIAYYDRLPSQMKVSSEFIPSKTLVESTCSDHFITKEASILKGAEVEIIEPVSASAEKN